MIDLSSLAPHLILLKPKDDSEETETAGEEAFTYTGSIESNGEFYYIHLEGTLNQNKEIESIELSCEACLNSLLLDKREEIQSHFDQCNTIQDVVFQLKHLIEKTTKDNQKKQFSFQKYLKDAKYFDRILKEVESIGWERLVESNDSLTSLTFQFEENSRIHTLKINIPENVSKRVYNRLLADAWCVLYFKFPQREPSFQTNLPTKFEFDWNETCSLKVIYEKFVGDVETYKQFWDEMKSLDENCWILEPTNPTLTDTHRRINMTDNVSLMIKVDPRNPKEIPELVFLGSDSAIEKYKTTFHENYHEWNSSFNLLFNLEEVLNLKFPQKTETTDSQNLECSICYSYLLENQGPSVYCEEVKCSKAFHQPCLYEWLKGISSSKVMFGFIYGDCPYCAEVNSSSAYSKSANKKLISSFKSIKCKLDA